MNAPPSEAKDLLGLTAADIMTSNCIVVSADQTMDSAAEQFLCHRVTGMPVVDSAGACVGVLSATDFIWHERSGTPDDPVRLYMTPKVWSVSPDERLDEVGRIMCAQHIHRIPVIDTAGQAVGIISALDIVALLVGAPRPLQRDASHEGKVLHC